MDGISMELTGLNESLGKLETSVRKVNTGANQVLRKGGEVIQKSIEAHTPVGEGTNPGGHARDNVGVSTVRTDGGTSYKHLFAGYNSNSYWYMWFLEKGTYSGGNPKGISPRNQTEKAFRASQSQVQEVMARELKELVGRVN